MLLDLKDKLQDPDFTKKIPILAMLVIVIVTVISFGITRFQISGAQKELVKVQIQMEELQAKVNISEKQDAQSFSALSYGRKVADLESDWSGNLTKAELAENEADKERFLGKTKSMTDDLKSYFKDVSYTKVWLPAQKFSISPYWDFGTKYNMNSGLEEFPVVWVCYDGQTGGRVLAYTTAIFHTEEAKFSDAKTVVMNVQDMYQMTEDRLTVSLLDMLQTEPVSVAQTQAPLFMQDLISSDTASKSDTETIRDEDTSGTTTELDTKKLEKKPTGNNALDDVEDFD